MNSTYTIAARPTRYAGTQFRSRLEARWAAFFDLAGWKWEYEPVDLNGWVPDFYLMAEREPIPVEIKPLLWPKNPAADICAFAEERSDLAKAFQCPAKSLILGAYLPEYAGPWGNKAPALGVLTNEYREGNELGGADVALIWEGTESELDFAAAYGCYAHRISGEWDGDCHLRSVGYEKVERLWRESGNRTQWRGVSRRG